MSKLISIWKKLRIFLKKKRKKIKITLSIAMILILIIGVFDISILGQVTDFFLHPLLGEKNTLQLESVYFGLQDKIESVDYKLFGLQPPTYSRPDMSVPVKAVMSEQMNLTDLKVFSGMKALPGEGKWEILGQSMAQSFIRPDIDRPYAIVSLVKMNMKKLGLGTEAGTYYPGGTHGVYGPGIVPKSIQAAGSLMAVFNGGFQEKDGHYGMVVGKKVYVPLKKGIPAIYLYLDGSVQFIDNYVGQAVSKAVAAIRQNGPYLVDNGVVTSYVEEGPDTWGRTTTNNMYTWRSGLGITRNGNLIYAVGNSLVPQTLARALVDAGAYKAIQLDINPPWIKFIVFENQGNGHYRLYPLLKSMLGGERYLYGNNKDFFYVYKKN